MLTSLYTLFLTLLLLTMTALLYQQYSPSLPRPTQSMAELVPTMRRRVRTLFTPHLARLEKVCEKEGGDNHGGDNPGGDNPGGDSGSDGGIGKINSQIWSVSPSKGLVMCRTAKHGSTTWANYFVQIYSGR